MWLISGIFCTYFYVKHKWICPEKIYLLAPKHGAILLVRSTLLKFSAISVDWFLNICWLDCLNKASRRASSCQRCGAPLRGFAFDRSCLFCYGGNQAVQSARLLSPCLSIFSLAAVDAVSLPCPNGGPVSGRNSQKQPAARGGSWEGYRAFSF